MNSSLPLSIDADKSIGSRVSNLLIKMLGEKGEKAENKWTKVHGLLARLSEETERRKKFPGTKVFEKRMYDIVLDREEPSLSPKEKRSQLGLIHEGMKLFDSMPDKATAARNASTSQNYRMFSPRFMPLAPDKGGPANPKSILSPTLFAMYEEKDNNSIVNVPEMLRSAGIGEKDRQKLIAGLMELTGSTNTAEKALQLLKNVDFFEEGVGGPILKAIKRTVGAFFALEDSLDRVQRKQCSQNGYTFARKEQIAKLLRDQSIDVQQMPDMAKFDTYDRMSAEEKEMALWATIESIALNEPPVQNHNSSSVARGGNHRRVKRTFAVHLNEPLILSPFHFSPTYGLVVMGPAVLSPSIFSPYILAPSVLSPLILSPLGFSPLILSPSALSPWIITPGLFNPYIISPYVFSPFILGPLIFHPFILSPYVLSPNVLNPYLLSPIILNPIALSPDILSPQVLGGAVFSPAFLSPAIFTQTFLMVSIFSPTFLS
ncbi:hypothetical protein niasHT_014196 [Heterodera trifolii]|uniref:Uncharacterized protein n=1 Tax=Heterodera trifolii TaxID=157864 RepID=A0ABD2KXF1_9BILA